MLGPDAKDGAADPNMGRTMGNRRVVVSTHAHTQSLNSIALCNVRKKVKVRRGIFICRRDAHQPGDVQTNLITTRGNEPVSIFWQCSGLLGFLAGVDLQKQIRVPALSLDFTRKHARKFDPIDGMYGVEQGHCVLGLVGLQGTNQMYMGIRKGFAKRRPFLLCFLNSVFTKDPLARLKDGNNRLDRKRLADRDKRNGVGRASRINGDGFNPGTDGLKWAMGAGVWSGAHGS